jgi:hypothetical protein
VKHGRRKMLVHERQILKKARSLMEQKRDRWSETEAWKTHGYTSKRWQNRGVRLSETAAAKRYILYMYWRQGGAKMLKTGI